MRDDIVRLDCVFHLAHGRGALRLRLIELQLISDLLVEASSLASDVLREREIGNFFNALSNLDALRAPFANALMRSFVIELQKLGLSLNLDIRVANRRRAFAFGVGE